ncbi:Glycerol dehydrogenase [Clostridium sp. DL-VIII]|uniref:iron-containing alcohol dehydrogenase family protein n=1 Tax=Clostridium sp. DL-VIII TaxID=641107 RepID=UPI00023B03A6|nr:iron-containing alcohol dehydrogenase family protein [Clostridium sp. DL-VIII]EHJ01836.1 Glycerol dehydrogenase [Clostridium sp. DL-VIII]
MSAINVPRYYENRRGIIKEAGDYIRRLGKNVLIVGGNNALTAVGGKFYKSLEINEIKYEVKIFTGYPTQKCIREISAMAVANKNDVIIGVGGGKVLDLVKAVGNKINMAVVTIPTIPATCAAWSALAVIYKENGEQDIYIHLENSPQLILADKDILSKAPKRYINSGVADTIAKWYEIAPDLKGNKDDFSIRLQLKVCELALEFLKDDYVKSAIDGSLFDKAYLIDNAVDSIIMLAGLAGSINGSVPYGGLAHPFYNNSTKIHETHKLLHGEKVIFGLLVQFVLEGRDEREILGFVEWMKKLNLPITLDDLGIKSNIREKVTVIAKGMLESIGNYSGLSYVLNEKHIIDAIFKVDSLGKNNLNRENGINA